MKSKKLMEKCYECGLKSTELGSCRGCASPVCPTKGCNLRHRALDAKSYPAYSVLPVTCKNERLKMDLRTGKAEKALAIANTSLAELMAKMLTAPRGALKKLCKDVVTAERVMQYKQHEFNLAVEKSSNAFDAVMQQNTPAGNFA